jgi:3-methyladenine DNA glycosylase AlkD
MSTPQLADLIATLESMNNEETAKGSAWFFKTGPGEYGEGDRFRGIRVPVLRKLVKEYRTLAHSDLLTLLHSPWHEDRLLALLLWVDLYRKGDAARRQVIYDDYLANRAYINNWDLIDSSASDIVGAQLYANGEFKGPIELLTTLAQSPTLWDRRIAIMATFHFIRKGEFAETLRVADLLLQDKEDLIHKAVGWMLREIGERELAVEEEFLLSRYKTMPRTMLRYAIEKFPEERRQGYLRGTIS